MRRFGAKTPVQAVVLTVLLGACAQQVEFVEAFPNLADPTETGAVLPEGYRESLPRDLIAPIYDPEFVGVPDVPWDDDDLVIGVNIEGEARAYPVGLLAFSEIVVDNHRGIPTLVTW